MSFGWPIEKEIIRQCGRDISKFPYVTKAELHLLLTQVLPKVFNKRIPLIPLRPSFPTTEAFSIFFPRLPSKITYNSSQHNQSTLIPVTANMQAALQKAGEAVGVAPNKKIADMKRNTRVIDSTPMTNDHGVKQSNTDITLSASTSERKGPQLLEDNWAREKVCA